MEIYGKFFWGGHLWGGLSLWRRGPGRWGRRAGGGLCIGGRGLRSSGQRTGWWRRCRRGRLEAEWQPRAEIGDRGGWLGGRGGTPAARWRRLGFAVRDWVRRGERLALS